MTTTTAPLRLTFGGGGSDLVNGTGLCLSATINHAVTVTVTPTWDPVYRLHYSEIEEAAKLVGIRHRIIRRTLEKFSVRPGIQIISVAEIPAGTGLGSSGAFTVALLKALQPSATRTQLASWACELDAGQQDQWSATYGGLNVYDFAARTVRPIQTSLTAIHFALYYTNMRHDSATLLTGPGKTPAVAEQEVRDTIHAFEDDDLHLLGFEMTSQWHHKLVACPSREHRVIDTWINAGITAGAYGGKLIGAGNGGFVLFATDTNLDDIMHPLRRIPFEFVDEGVRCV
jgi:D-glycero-alpha-D-manno-heptose-7-phosphate kinase